MLNGKPMCVCDIKNTWNVCDISINDLYNRKLYTGRPPKNEYSRPPLIRPLLRRRDFRCTKLPSPPFLRGCPSYKEGHFIIAEELPYKREITLHPNLIQSLTGYNTIKYYLREESILPFNQSS